MTDNTKKTSFCVGATRDSRKLFGMAHPGLLRGLEEDLELFVKNDIGAIVTLTEHDLILPLPYRSFFRQLHLPIENFGPPTLTQVIQFVRFVDAEFQRGVNVVAHCIMGIGRTGTMLAAYRVRLGEYPDDAIASLRALRPFIETPEQEGMVHAYHEYLTKKNLFQKDTES
jgi:atypical dual specificity phosphatase